MEINEKQIQILQKIQNLLFISKSVFAIDNLRWDDGSSRCTAKVCVIRPSRAKLFNLIQVFPFVTTRPCYFLPCTSLPSVLLLSYINFTFNVLMFVIRYEIMLITSPGLHVPK